MSEPLTVEDVVDVMTDVMKLPPSPALVYAARAVLDLFAGRVEELAHHFEDFVEHADDGQAAELRALVSRGEPGSSD